jgi:hypothetical protein
VGFNKVKPHERVEPYGIFRIVLDVVYVGISGDKLVYAVLLKERHVHHKKHVRSGLYSRSDFVGFVYDFIFVSGPLSLLREP